MSAEILESIRKSVHDRGYPPTIRELAREHGLSIGTIHTRLVQLEEAGMIIREEGPRAIRITGEGKHDGQ